ncbi:MAG: carbohydrate kinase [Lachnospiraceae bacterium]|nr:carbohydrate kinase [Lachnospiraceae bacterium]
MKIAGLDIGTTGCKLSVFDVSGKYLDRAYQDYPVKRGHSEHEVDAQAILEKVMLVIREMAAKYPDIEGIGVTSFGESFVMTDEQGIPLHPVMLYTDPRGKEECEQLLHNMDSLTLTSITGVKPHEMYSISKMMWIKKHRPEIYRQARHIFLMEDFVVFHLTGTAQVDYSLAARTMAFDISSLKWSGEIFKLADIDMSLMSETVPTGTSAGTILERIAKKTGLSKGTQIVSVSHDQLSATVGAGVFTSDKAAEGAGTVECVIPIYDELPDLKVMREGNYAVVPYVIPGKYIAYAFSYTGGALIQWCVDTLAKKEKEIAAEKGVSVNLLLEREETEPTGILVLPHFAGAATPYMDTGSKGAIVGLTAAHNVSDIYRACMEGVVYEMQINMDYLKESGVCFEKMHATGGGAKSKVWMQMKADVLNMPITALATVDAGTVGSAMLTGIAIGCFRDLDDAAEHMVEEMETYYPRPEVHRKYMNVYARYKQLYHAVRPLV